MDVHDAKNRAKIAKKYMETNLKKKFSGKSVTKHVLQWEKEQNS